jgi:hypothetical protein
MRLEQTFLPFTFPAGEAPNLARLTDSNPFLQFTTLSQPDCIYFLDSHTLQYGPDRGKRSSLANLKIFCRYSKVRWSSLSMTSAQRAEACRYIWTPPQLCIPFEAGSFGFTVRCIRDE